MKKIGLDADTLFEKGKFALIANPSDLVVDTFEDPELREKPGFLNATATIARQEEVIKSVAIMIEENNAAILNQLISAGVLKD